MSLREELAQAQAEGHRLKANAEKAGFGRSCAEMANALPGHVRTAAEALRGGKEPHEVDKSAFTLRLKFVTLLHDALTLATLQEIPGFRALHEVCAGPGSDLCLSVRVSPLMDGCCLAVTVDPWKPFKESDYKDTYGSDESSAARVVIPAQLPPLPDAPPQAAAGASIKLVI
jgi:hypothetical protein